MSKIAAVVAYPSQHPESGEKLIFDIDYYLASHRPMIERTWGPHGLKSWSINTFADSCPLTRTRPLYLVQTTCYFEKVDNLKLALEKGGDETRPDVEKFSNVFPVIWVGQVGGRMYLLRKMRRWRRVDCAVLSMAQEHSIMAVNGSIVLQSAVDTSCVSSCGVKIVSTPPLIGGLASA